MKHVGLNVAADPLFTLSYTGVNGGMVIFVADDPAMHSSQNEQDSRHYAIAAKVPMLEPADSAEAKAFVKAAFEISEEFDTPVIVRMCTRIAHSQAAVELEDRVERELPAYEKNPQKYIMAPANAIRRHPFVEERTRRIAELSETSPLNRVELGGTEIGIICSGTCYQYVKEVFDNTVSVLKLGIVNPLPTQIIKDFASNMSSRSSTASSSPISTPSAFPALARSFSHRSVNTTRPPSARRSDCLSPRTSRWRPRSPCVLP